MAQVVIAGEMTTVTFQFEIAEAELSVGGAYASSGVGPSTGAICKAQIRARMGICPSRFPLHLVRHKKKPLLT